MVLSMRHRIYTSLDGLSVGRDDPAIHHVLCLARPAFATVQDQIVSQTSRLRPRWRRSQHFQ